MSTTGELVSKMVQAYAKGRDDSFREAVVQFILEERRKNHHVLANEIERLLSNGSKNTNSDSTRTLTLLGIRNAQLPHDKERGLPLVEVSEPIRRMEDFVLSTPVREELIRIIEENRKAELLHTYGLRQIQKVLFCGPPGCGKTVAAEAIAQALYLPLVLVRFDAVVSSYLGETSANLRKVFDFARTRPMVILFDEFDAIGKSRTDESEHGELKRVVNSFLQMLDNFHGETLVIAATNHETLLDTALWRRFDEIVFFAKPSQDAIQEILLRNLRQIGLAHSISLKETAATLMGMSHADVERTAIETVKRVILDDRTKVEADDLAQAVDRQMARTGVTHRSTDRTRGGVKRNDGENDQARLYV